MRAPHIYLEPGTRVDLVFPDGTREVFRASGPFRSFGVAWQCAAPLAGNGDPVLFWSEFETVKGSNIGKGYTLRRDDEHGRPVFAAVTVLK